MEASKKTRYKSRIIWIVNTFADITGHCAIDGGTFVPVINTPPPGMAVHANREWPGVFDQLPFAATGDDVGHDYLRVKWLGSALGN